MQAAKAVIQAARFFLEKNMKNPVSYRLLRSSLWYLLPLPDPEPDKEGKRMTPIPFPAGKSKLERLLENEDWESLIRECETVFVDKIEIGGGGCFCLDIQRFLSTALKEMVKASEEGGNMGDKDAYETINKIILQETAMLLERLPWITELLYSNGAAFADNQTKRWIDKSVKTVFGANPNALQSQNVGVVAGGSSSDGDSQISEEFKKAAELLDKDKWGESIDLMQKGIDTDPTHRGRFQRRLNLAQLCLSAIHPDMARVLLEQLDTEIERFSLEEWEPSLCLQVWTHLSRCYKQTLSQKGQQEDNRVYQEKADMIFEKICRLDIRAAALATNAG